MKQILSLFLLLLLSSCSFLDQQARIEFDNSQKTVRVLSHNFKISNIFIREITPSKKADTAFTAIDFEPFLKVVELAKIKEGHYSGQPIKDIMSKQNLEYTFILKGKLEDIEITRSITFRSNDAQTEKVFYSNF